jgi:hypothetical protein
MIDFVLAWHRWEKHRLTELEKFVMLEYSGCCKVFFAETSQMIAGMDAVRAGQPSPSPSN